MYDIAPRDGNPKTVALYLLRTTVYDPSHGLWGSHFLKITNL
jgi:hypothetical protein